MFKLNMKPRFANIFFQLKVYVSCCRSIISVSALHILLWFFEKIQLEWTKLEILWNHGLWLCELWDTVRVYIHIYHISIKSTKIHLNPLLSYHSTSTNMYIIYIYRIKCFIVNSKATSKTYRNHYPSISPHQPPSETKRCLLRLDKSLLGHFHGTSPLSTVQPFTWKITGKLRMNVCLWIY